MQVVLEWIIVKTLNMSRKQWFGGTNTLLKKRKHMGYSFELIGLMSEMIWYKKEHANKLSLSEKDGDGISSLWKNCAGKWPKIEQKSNQFYIE